MNDREPRPPVWLSWLVIVVGSLLVFGAVRLLGGAEWLAWAFVLGWTIVVGHLGYRIGR